MDLTVDKALQVQNKGQEGIGIKLDRALLRQLQNATGFISAIINMQLMQNLSEFLGITIETH